MATGRRRTHMTLGGASVALAAVMVFTRNPGCLGTHRPRAFRHRARRIDGVKGSVHRAYLVGLPILLGVQDLTVSDERNYEPLERFLDREQPDFIQVNYSITEREAEQRILPLASDKGIAVMINRPFMNGVYFDRLGGAAVPDWAAEFDCTSWAQFSLKYILADPHLTCVLTETTNPVHMAENARSAFGRMPDAAARERMRRVIDELI